MEQNDKNTFSIYLEKKKFTDKSIRRTEGIVKKYQKWLKEKHLEIEETKYKDILNYIGHLQDQKYKKSLINEYLQNISHYYEYRKLENPTLEVRLIGEQKIKLPLFKSEELDKIYENFKPLEIGIYRHTDKLILSLIIYQAIDRKSMLNLRIDDIYLEKGKLRVPESGRIKQERILILESHQIMSFNHFINKIRLKYNDKLFTRACENEEKLNDQLKVLYKKVRDQSKKINLELERFNQLRQSRYCIWLKQYGIRKAQYMAGFKNPNSIQAYQDMDLEDLRSCIEKYHPLK